MLNDKEKAELLEQRTRDEYAFHEYPKVLYRDRPKGFKPAQEGAWVPPEAFETLIVDDADAEIAALDDNWRATPHKDA